MNKNKTNKVIKLNFRLDQESISKESNKETSKESNTNKSTVINLKDKQLSKIIKEIASLNRPDEDLLEG